MRLVTGRYLKTLNARVAVSSPIQLKKQESRFGLFRASSFEPPWRLKATEQSRIPLAFHYTKITNCDRRKPHCRRAIPAETMANALDYRKFRSTQANQIKGPQKL